MPADAPVIVFCRNSIRGCEASIILRKAGHADVRVLDGGVIMWPCDKGCGQG